MKKTTKKTTRNEPKRLKLAKETLQDLKPKAGEQVKGGAQRRQWPTGCRPGGS